MHLWQILYIFIVYQLNVGLTLSNSSHGTNFTHWSEDDWLETRFFIDTKFLFNHQYYEYVNLRTRMNEWSLELLDSNRSNINQLWTELYLFIDHHTSLNNSIPGNINNLCYSPIISPLTNDSNTRIPELSEMDENIGNYFINEGFFRTINYIRCTIDEQREDPPIHIQMDIYLVTNRDFQSLICIEMSNTTQKSLLDYQARFYIHTDKANFRYNFNISNVNYQLNSSTSLVHMIKLYNSITPGSNKSITRFSNMIIILFNFILFGYFFHL